MCSVGATMQGNNEIGEEYRAYDFSTQPSRIEYTILNIARRNPEELPDCMNHYHFSCRECYIENERTCLIAKDPYFASYLRYRLEFERSLRKALQTVLREHGRPMYWDIIADMVKARYPDLEAPKHTIYVVLNTSTADFKNLEPGVYGLAEWELPQP